MFQVLLRRTGEERTGKQGPYTLYKNRTRFVTAWLLQLGEMLRTKYRWQISIAGTVLYFMFITHKTLPTLTRSGSGKIERADKLKCYYLGLWILDCTLG